MRLLSTEEWYPGVESHVRLGGKSIGNMTRQKGWSLVTTIPIAPTPTTSSFDLAYVSIP